MKLYSKIFLLSLIVSLMSCGDFLNKAPLESLSQDSFWKTKADADLWMIGMYHSIQECLGDNIIDWGEVRSDNFNQTGTGSDYISKLSNAMLPTFACTNWTSLYKVIAGANMGIKYLPGLQVAESIKNDYIAQCYTARALMYFYAIRVWGDVPLVTDAFEGKEGQEMFVARTEVAKVKEQIIADLKEADKLFEPSVTDPTHLNKGAALATLADVYMWFGEYQNAVDALDKLDGLNYYKLANNLTDWRKTFENPTQALEPIFFVDWDITTDGQNCINILLANKVNTAKYSISQPLYDTMINREKADFRFTQIMDTTYIYYMENELEPLTTDSWENIYNSTKGGHFTKYGIANPEVDYTLNDDIVTGGYDYPDNIELQPMLPVYRYADMYLLRAEAYNRLGRGDEARAIINEIRENVGYIRTEEVANPDYEEGVSDPTVTPATIMVEKGERLDATNAPTGEVLAAIILNERRIELAGEGKRWFDLIRNDKVVEIMDPILRDVYEVSSGFGDDPRLILSPINSAIFQANHLIVQNEPYTQY